MKKYYGGIDPGKKGAAVIIDDRMNVVFFRDTPLVASGKKTVYDLSGMMKIVNKISEFYAVVCVEAQRAMPKQGVTSQFSIGFGYGVWTGILTASNISYFQCAPKEWQKHALAGQPGEGKARAILRCEQLFPRFPLTRDGIGGKILDGRSDAAMMAYYAYLSDGKIRKKGAKR